MKILTANFVTCAVKACKSSPESFPLHFHDAELEQTDIEFNPTFVRNILPHIEWNALRITAAELGFSTLPEAKPEVNVEPENHGGQEKTEGMNAASESSVDDKLWRDLHKLLLETQVVEGKMVCGNCGHEYKIKEGIANFLLPNHLV